MKLSFLEDSKDLIGNLSSFIPVTGTDSKISSIVAEILDSVNYGQKKIKGKKSENENLNKKIQLCCR